jgi:hypothetical protein
MYHVFLVCFFPRNLRFDFVSPSSIV